jgi:NTE family protein
MTTAVVLSGGANLGAVHVGMLRALVEHGVIPDSIIGTSVGALNGAYMASRWDRDGVDGLDRVWTGLSVRKVFPTRLIGGLLGFIGRRDHLVSNDGVRRIIRHNLQFERLEDAPIPLHVVATDLLTGIDRRFSEGPARDVVLASAAIPGVFPPITIDGVPFIDGGVVNNTPITHAVELGATTVWVLPAGTACSLDAAPSSALAIALHAVSVLINRRLERDVRALEDRCDLRVVPPLCPVTVGPTEFGEARDLIDRAYRQTTRWLETRESSMMTPSEAFTHPHDRG